MTQLQLRLEGDTHVIVTRKFAAPPDLVYRAHIEPELMQRWMLGPPGWTMPVCISEPRPGGKMRFEWTNGESGFYLTGESHSCFGLGHVEFRRHGRTAIRADVRCGGFGSRPRHIA